MIITSDEFTRSKKMPKEQAMGMYELFQMLKLLGIIEDIGISIREIQKPECTVTTYRSIAYKKS